MADDTDSISDGAVGAAGGGLVRKATKELMAHHNQMMDHYRSIDDIVKEGSNPSASSRFHSSSARDNDSGD